MIFLYLLNAIYAYQANALSPIEKINATTDYILGEFRTNLEALTLNFFTDQKSNQFYSESNLEELENRTRIHNQKLLNQYSKVANHIITQGSYKVKINQDGSKNAAMRNAQEMVQSLSNAWIDQVEKDARSLNRRNEISQVADAVRKIHPLSHLDSKELQNIWRNLPEKGRVREIAKKLRNVEKNAKTTSPSKLPIDHGPNSLKVSDNINNIDSEGPVKSMEESLEKTLQGIPLGSDVVGKELNDIPQGPNFVGKESEDISQESISVSKSDRVKEPEISKVPQDNPIPEPELKGFVFFGEDAETQTKFTETNQESFKPDFTADEHDSELVKELKSKNELRTARMKERQREESFIHDFLSFFKQKAVKIYSVVFGIVGILYALYDLSLKKADYPELL